MKKDVKKNPTSLKAISILFYVLAVLSIVFGGILLVIGIGSNFYIDSVGSQEILNIIQSDPSLGAELQNLQISDVDAISSLLLVVGIVGGIISIGLGILYIFVGKGLSKRKRWAWIAAIVLVCLGLLKQVAFAGIGMGLSIISLIVLLVVGYFLVFDKEIKKIFSK